MRRLSLLLVVVATVSMPAGTADGGRADHPCVAGSDVVFRAGDGTRLVGRLFGSGREAVVLGHQSEGSLCEWVPAARRLARLGYTAFAFDFRGHGLSQDRAGAAANRLALDVSAAVRVVRARGKRKVFLVGASMGGIAALTAAADAKPAVDGVVSVSAPARFMGMDAVASARRLRVPVLYLAAENDDNAGYDFSRDARTMFRATAATDKRLRILPGGLHGVSLLGGSPRARELADAFLRRH